MNLNDTFRSLHLELPSDVARRKAAGDLEGAARLIDRYLERTSQPELRDRLTVERYRLSTLAEDYCLTREEALAQYRAEWPDGTEAQFDALVDDGRIDWRMVDGQVRYHDRFVASLHAFCQLAPELPADDYRAKTLKRMHDEGSVSAYITVRATIRAEIDVEGKEVQAWLPIPAPCPQQDWMEILECTPGGVCAPEDAPQRTVWWKTTGQKEFSVTYRYLHRAVYTDPLTLTADSVQPDFCLNEQLPHIQFTPHLRDLAARLTAGLTDPIQKAKAIYDYVTCHMDYRFQPAYIQLDPLAQMAAKDLRGDCGMFALLFITLCRLSGIPAKWQSGLSVRPGFVGSHDWAMFYVAPHGWLWADCSFGSGARHRGEEELRRHYFGNLDPWRMVANCEFQAPLTPPMTGWRNDPYDNQSGEIMVDGQGLTGAARSHTRELIEYQLL